MRLLAQFPFEEYELLHEYVPGEEVCSINANEWRFTFNGSSTHRFTFDGSSTYQGSSVKVVLLAPEGTIISFAFTLEFPYTNNEVEYEALVMRLTSALRMGSKNSKYKEA